MPRAGGIPYLGNPTISPPFTAAWCAGLRSQVPKRHDKLTPTLLSHSCHVGRIGSGPFPWRAPIILIRQYALIPGDNEHAKRAKAQHPSVA
ncbi:hypothetical protein M0657_000037 [Pyricularia oryzae]|nr:hypothetical protein M9X92_007650 [Pyricularia oryzae]KAI7932728.1 hypothetical protein M0657_000037 [Pyricularia oryzae]